MASFHTVNPATESLIAEYTYHTVQQIEKSVDSTYNTWKQWRNQSFHERSKVLNKASQLLRSEKNSLGHLITTEMGKPIEQSIAEIEKCAWVCEYYAQNAEKFLSSEHIETEATESYVHHSPMGIVLAIMPWNFPFWQVFRFAAPALMAGNAALLKHSPNTTGCALEIERIITESGAPKGLLNTIIAKTEDVEAIIANPKVAAVTLTGSTRAGKSVAALAGKYLKKSVLELGGSDPYIILDDADLDIAAEECVSGRILNTGQSCIAAKRFIVTKKNASKFTELVKQELAKKQYGDPFSNPDLGSMAREDLRDQLHKQVQNSIEQGATCLLGGKIPNAKGFFYPATLLTSVKPGMPAYEEELFGPVAVIITASDQNEALQIANDSSYGLGAAIFTKDVKKAKEIAEEKIEAGCVFINTFVKSDPRLPFGGIKNSGYGRELSHHGIREFTNTQTIYVK